MILNKNAQEFRLFFLNQNTVIWAKELEQISDFYDQWQSITYDFTDFEAYFYKENASYHVWMSFFMKLMWENRKCH